MKKQPIETFQSTNELGNQVEKLDRAVHAQRFQYKNDCFRAVVMQRFYGRA